MPETAAQPHMRGLNAFRFACQWFSKRIEPGASLRQLSLRVWLNQSFCDYPETADSM